MKPHGFGLVNNFVEAAMLQMGILEDRLHHLDELVGQHMDVWREDGSIEQIEFDGNLFVCIMEEGERSVHDAYGMNVIRFAEEFCVDHTWTTRTPVLDLHPWDASVKEVADAGAGAGACSLLCIR
jgi:hypothetical protein